MNKKIAICKKTRSIAAETLAASLRDIFSKKGQISETDLRDQWLVELRKNPTIFPDGWYVPPPHGIGVLFGEAKKAGRQNYKTLRSEEMWPNKNIFLDDKNEMAYLFASPVDRKTGIIGDFGLTIYRGDKQEIKDHLRKCMQVNREIFNHIEVGVKFSEVFNFAEKIVSSYGMTNNVTSTTDPTGRDYGHTIPATYLNWTESAQAILEKGASDWESVKNIISKKRVFVNPIEETKYQPGMAITLEPRLTVFDDPNIPMGSFHTIVVIHEDGSKELLTNFDELFTLFGMDYML